MRLDLDVQVAVATPGLPGEDALREWVGTALQGAGAKQAAPELSIRIVDEAEMTALNQRYRGKSGPTNVLSFPFEAAAEVDTGLLGDIVICAPVVAEEARAQDKPLHAHWAHMVIHGVLHLLGYDHHHEQEAEEMERLETTLLEKLGIPDPYEPVEGK